MKESHALALIVAYYLSRFDDIAYKQLGFSSITETHRTIGQILGVKPSSVKNMRDEFDPLHANLRVGWHRRPMLPSRARVVESFHGLSEEELRDVVLEVISNPDFSKSVDFRDVISSLVNIEGKGQQESVFVVRGPTGRKAEEYFIKYHRETGHPVTGELVDTRDDGCGYDFHITSNGQRFFVEVKGLDAEVGGVSFTSKEWDIACEAGDRYYLVLVRNLSSEPIVLVVQNPAKMLSPKKRVFTTVQVRWNVPSHSIPVL